MGSRYLKVSFMIMGLSGIIAQIILLRELLVSFLGNELIIGIILANWMLLEGVGSFIIGKSVEKVKRKLELYVLFQLIFSCVLPFSIMLSRIFKNIFFAGPGEAVGFFPIYYASLIILMPVSITHGALFTYGCRNYSYYSEQASSAGKVYFLETIGSIAGGVLFTFFMIQFFHSFEIAFTVSFLNTTVSIFLLLPEGKYGPSFLKKGLLGISIFLTFLFALLLFTPISGEIQNYSIKRQWRGLDVIHYENSIYGNIIVTRMDEQFTFYVDGVPSITTPNPDIATIEDFVHFSMLFHENPENILVISGGAGGMINEILKYPVKQVDYVELDPLLIKLVEKFSTPLTYSELTDSRVNVYYMDGRLFVNKTKNLYDVVFIGLDAPQELQTNRFYSLEFFSEVSKRMKTKGIIAITLPGSLTYISPELRDLNGCILDTLKSVFLYIKVIPGDVNIYLASDSRVLEKLAVNVLAERFEKRKVKTSLFTDAYIRYRLHERWIRWFYESIQRKKSQINSDFHPLGVFFYLSYWNALFSPYLLKIFKLMEGISITLFLSFFACFILIIIFSSIRGKSKISIPYSIFTTGFCGTIFDLAIIFTFQTIYGYLYYQIGFLVTVFMAGVAVSSYSITRYMQKSKKDNLIFLVSEFIIICFTLGLPFVFRILTNYLKGVAGYNLIYIIFLLISFISGALIGFQFPLASKIHLSILEKKGLGYTAGLLYGADLSGGYFGGLIGGIFLLPVLGLGKTCFILAIFKSSSFIFFFVFKKLNV